MATRTDGDSQVSGGPVSPGWCFSARGGGATSVSPTVPRRGNPRLYGKLFSNTGPQQLFGGQQLIHRAGTESLQVESDEFESKSFEHGGELAGHLRG
jgi:hypothetical protein